MRTDALLPILYTMAETAAAVRAEYLWSKAYRNLEGMLEALAISLDIESDLASLLDDRPYEQHGLGAIKVPKGTPEEIIEAMRTIALIESAGISRLLKTVPGDVPELEERRVLVTDRKIEALGRFFRKMKQILQENWPGYWTRDEEKEFARFLKMKAPKRR